MAEAAGAEAGAEAGAAKAGEEGPSPATMLRQTSDLGMPRMPAASLAPSALAASWAPPSRLGLGLGYPNPNPNL